MEFTFTVASTGNKYIAEEVEGGFVVKWQDDFGKEHSHLYSDKCVEHYINNGSWVDFKEVEPKNTFTIKEGQIEAVARFIIANNSYLHHHTVDSMIVKIKCTIKRMVNNINKGRDDWYTGSAGYVVTIMEEDDNYYVVDVLVDPTVSQDNEFINVEEII